MTEEAQMSDDSLYKFERNGKAIMAAGISGLVLGGIGICAVSEKNLNAIPGFVCGGFAATSIGAILGLAGASTRSLNRASLAGACIAGIGGIVVAVLLILSPKPSLSPRNLPQELWQGTWLVAAAASFGSILAQVGALAGATTTTSDIPSPTRQFTLRQLLAFFIPVAIYFGYVSMMMRK